MPSICYVPRNFTDSSIYLIAHARRICAEYAEQGYDLTLRQLYYQFVARDLIRNKDSEYKRLGSVINDARLAGYLDWKYIVDRTRNVQQNGHWNSPAEIVDSAVQSFMHDKWADQEYYVEVWIEKDALVGVLEACCPDEDVSFFSCRGYTSQSEMWGAAQRIGRQIKNDKKAMILHLGDHDPSGIDMTRDIEERLAMFIAQDMGIAPTLGDEGWQMWEYPEQLEDWFNVERIALNMNQVQQYNPPPNPAKLTDARATKYMAIHGRYSWELDALDPATLVELIRSNIAYYRDDELWENALAREEEERQILAQVSERWDDVRDFLNGAR